MSIIKCVIFVIIGVNYSFTGARKPLDDTVKNDYHSKQSHNFGAVNGKLILTIAQSATVISKKCMTNPQQKKQSMCFLSNFMKSDTIDSKEQNMDDSVMLILYSTGDDTRKMLAGSLYNTVIEFVAINETTMENLKSLNTYIGIIDCKEQKTKCKQLEDLSKDERSDKEQPIGVLIHTFTQYSQLPHTHSMPLYLPKGDIELNAYLLFRLLERKLEIDSHRNKLNLYLGGKSNDNQTQTKQESEETKEIRVTYMPFSGGACNAYYRHFSTFLESILLLKNELPSLSVLIHKNDKHTLQLTVGIGNKIYKKYSTELTNVNQFSSFILYSVFKHSENQIDNNVPRITKYSDKLSRFLMLSNTYVVLIVPTEEQVHDVLTDDEDIKLIRLNIELFVKQSMYNLLISKSAALELYRGATLPTQIVKAHTEAHYLIKLPGQNNFISFKASTPVEQITESIKSIGNQIQNEVDIVEKMELEMEQSANNDYIPPESHLITDKTDQDSQDSDQVEKYPADSLDQQSDYAEVYNAVDIKIVENDSKLRDNLIPHIKSSNTSWLVVYVVSWNPVCKAARTILSAVSQCINQYKSLQVAKVDCFEMNKHCESQGIHRYPTVVLYHNDGRSPVIYNSTISVNQMCAFGMSDGINIVETYDKRELQKNIKVFRELLGYVFVVKGTFSDQLREIATQFSSNIVFLYYPGIDNDLSVEFNEKHSPRVIKYNGDNELSNYTSLLTFVTESEQKTVCPISFQLVSKALQSGKSLILLESHQTVITKKQLLRRFLRHFGSDKTVFVYNDNVASHGKTNTLKVISPKNGSYILTMQETPLKEVNNPIKWLNDVLDAMTTNRYNELPTTQDWNTQLQHNYNFVKEVYNSVAESTTEPEDVRVNVDHLNKDDSMDIPDTTHNIKDEL